MSTPEVVPIRQLGAHVGAEVTVAGWVYNRTDKGKLLTANVWLADIMTFDEMNRPWEAWLAPGAAPARATVEARIANPGYRVEIACSAAL